MSVDGKTNGRPRKRHPLRGKGGLVAIAVLAVLGVWLYLDLQRGEPTEPGEMPKMATVVGFKPEQVTRLEVKQGDKVLFTVARAGDEWRVEQPYQARADKDSVESLIKGLLDSSISRELPRSARNEPAKFGLDKPELEIVLRAGGKQRVLRTGKADVVGSDVYVDVSGYKTFIALAETHLNAFKNQKPEDLRDKRLIMADRDSLRRIEIRTASGEMILEKRGSEEWELVAPFRAKAHKYEVSGLIGRLTPLRAESFVVERPANLAEYGLDRPAVRLTVTDRNGTHTLLLGKQAPRKREKGRVAASDPGHYALREGDTAVFLLSKFDYDGLNKGTAELRDRTLLTFEEERAERITITNRHGEIELHKRGSDWFMVRPENVQADRDKISGILSSLRGDAHRHVEEQPADLNRYGLAKPAITVNVWTSGGKTQQLRVGAKVPGKEALWYAQTSNSPAVFSIQEFIHSDLNVKPEELKPEELRKSTAAGSNAPKREGGNRGR